VRNSRVVFVVVVASALLGLAPRVVAADPRPLPGLRGAIVEFRVVGDLPGTDALRLANPEAIAFDHHGNLVIADTGNHRVLIVSENGNLLDEFGGYGWEDDRLDTPSDVCVYEGFFTYVLDEGNRRVVSYDAQGDYVGRVVPEDEAGTPVSMAVTPSGGLHLVDVDSQSIISYSQFDEALEPVGRFGVDEGGLLDPGAVAGGPDREIAVADRGRLSVEVFDEFGARLYSVTMADTLLPSDVAFDDRGNLLVSDVHHGRLLAFSPGGGEPTAVLEAPDGLTPASLAIGRGGRAAVLYGRSGRIQLLELVHASETPAR
jgi:hypothetical protein